MRLFAVTLPAKRPAPTSRAIDPEIAEQVGQEILKNELEPAAWANALAVSGGRRQEALAAYARIRMQQVASRNRQRRAKAKSFEARRLTTCLGVKTVQDLLQRSNRGGQLNLAKPRLSFIWLAILLLGSAGTIASAGRLFGEFIPDRIERLIPAVALICGFITVGGVLLLRVVLPKRWVMLGWNLGLASACSLACFGSLCFGAKLIAHTSPEVIQRIASPPAEEMPREVPQLVKPKITPGQLPGLASGNEQAAFAE
ncbi:hypothetical protein [Luteolibacter marinus]|uniref:hypothetical protein n=1 Tax=Luteolibacter marinus TaxID=2776705 RepID=UPI001868D16B|nr:hypothetical protein [Luteolibacter marinus]